MIVLGRDLIGNKVLASLPTSKGHVPSDVEMKEGCIELPDRQVNVYVFLANKNIIKPLEEKSSFLFDVINVSSTNFNYL